MWRRLDREAPADLLHALLLRYTESHRHYHDRRHLVDCLQKSATCREIQRRPTEVDLALCYHDAIYDPGRGDNEERSAALAAGVLEPLLSRKRVERIRASILDTRHEGEPAAADGAVVVDVDLSILGADPERYEDYRRAIREEYSWVPESSYRRRRSRLLRSFLDRSRIFATPLFQERLESRARENLARELAFLEGSDG
ncbi:MAG: N-methyl-D-aspartate receptor NMDAR2C subunit [Thermoanaerobaculia bacterium]|nr:N-methyl-D-aspartate receptor NMDAR2C subunit [Thermoanaerobaculia bacterium]